jgi:hypothetical protein
MLHVPGTLKVERVVRSLSIETPERDLRPVHHGAAGVSDGSSEAGGTSPSRNEPS